jgi:hypothetical protein
MHRANASITRYAIRCWFLLGSKLSVTTSFRSVCTCLLCQEGVESVYVGPATATNESPIDHPPFWATPERTRDGDGSNGRVAVERRMRGVQPCTSLCSARTRSAARSWLHCIMHKVGITKVGITPPKVELSSFARTSHEHQEKQNQPDRSTHFPPNHPVSPPATCPTPRH